MLFNAWALDVGAGYILSWMFQGSPLKVLESVFLMPIAGVAIYLMKPWSYAVFLVAMGWSLVANIASFRYAQSAQISLPMLLVVYGVQLGLAIYFMLPSVRRTYFDSRVRWWEAQRRLLFQTSFMGQLAGQGLTGKILNISAGGALLGMLNRDLKKGDTMILRFEVNGVPFETPAEAVYVSPAGVGVRFGLTQDSAPKFVRMVKGLELIGVPFRDQEVATPWQQVASWAARFVKTGKGLTPELEVTKKQK